MPNISINVRVKTIRELIKNEIPSGKYWLPSFQRGYVWDPENIKDLLDSIVKNYPIGATILWKPSTAISEIVDPTAVPIMDGLAPGGLERYFVIDGQQRITSLLLLLNSWLIPRNGEKIKRSRIAFDHTHEKFIVAETRGTDMSEIIKAFCTADVVALTMLRNSTTEIVFPRIQEIANKIMDYPIPQYVMETTDEDDGIFPDMAEAFIRINKEGVRIGNVDLMLSFMAGTLGGDFRQYVADLDKRLNKDFSIAMQPVMRFVFSNFGLTQSQMAKTEQFKRNIQRIREEVPASEMKERFDESARSFEIALEFLKEEFCLGPRESEINGGRFDKFRLIPSLTTIIPVATYVKTRNLLSVRELQENDRKKISEWFVLVNLNGHYSASVDTRLQRDIELIRNSTSFPFSGLLENMKARSYVDYEFFKDALKRNVLRESSKAFLFILYILLVKKDAEDWSGTLLREREWSMLERHHIFPREYLGRELGIDGIQDHIQAEMKISNLANISFILKAENAAIGAKPPSEYLSQYIKFARLHFVPEGLEFWTKEAYSSGAFQDERLKLIFEAAQSYFPNVFRKE